MKTGGISKVKKLKGAKKARPVFVSKTGRTLTSDVNFFAEK